MSHESSVKEWRERAQAAEAQVDALQRQVYVMNEMLAQRDAMLRQAEFDQLVQQVEPVPQPAPEDQTMEDLPPLEAVPEFDPDLIDEDNKVESEV